MDKGERSVLLKYYVVLRCFLRGRGRRTTRGGPVVQPRAGPRPVLPRPALDRCTHRWSSQYISEAPQYPLRSQSKVRCAMSRILQRHRPVFGPIPRILQPCVAAPPTPGELALRSLLTPLLNRGLITLPLTALEGDHHAVVSHRGLSRRFGAAALRPRLGFCYTSPRIRHFASGKLGAKSYPGNRGRGTYSRIILWRCVAEHFSDRS